MLSWASMQQSTICTVCSLLDNDLRMKPCTYCAVCRAWICEDDIDNFKRRGKAMAKRMMLMLAVSLLSSVLLGCPWATESKKPITPVPDSTLPVVITVAPNTVSMVSGQTQRFTATVLNTTNTAVNWYSCSSTAISSTGLFTAPVVTKAASICVYAISLADPSKSSTAYAMVSPVVDKVSASLVLSSGNNQIVGQLVLYSWTANSSLGTITKVVLNCGDGTSQEQDLFSQAAGSTLTMTGVNNISTSSICNPVTVGSLKPSLTVTDSKGTVVVVTTSNTTLPTIACGEGFGFGWQIPLWEPLNWSNPVDYLFGGTETQPTVTPISNKWLPKGFTLPNWSQQYCNTLSAGQGFPPYTFSGTNLPPGLTVSNLNPTAGIISGIPTTAGVYTNVLLTVTDSNGTVSALAPRSIQICNYGDSCNGTGN